VTLAVAADSFGNARTRSLGRVASRVLQVLATVVPVALLASLLTFALTYLSPASPAEELLGPAATPAAIAATTRRLGLDRPFIVQYWSWLWNALHGNLGVSYFTQIPVSTSIAQRLPVDLSIALIAVVIALVVGFTSGILAARFRGRFIDKAVTALASLFITVPDFLVAIALIVIFTVKLRLLPSLGYVSPSTSFGQWFTHAILPGAALSCEPTADFARQLRTALVGVYEENFVTGAVVRGLSSRRVLFRHALRNALPAPITALGLHMPRLLGGAVVVELIFSLPGIGQYALEASEMHDIPVIQGMLITVVVLILIVNVVTNILAAQLRPSPDRR
jgi:peptide/nickel transport system permease protein